MEREEYSMRFYCRIEQPSANAEEGPDIDGEGEAEAQCDVEEVGRVGNASVRAARRRRVRYLRCRKGKEEKHKSSNELPKHGNEVVPDSVRHPADATKPSLSWPGGLVLYVAGGGVLLLSLPGKYNVLFRRLTDVHGGTCGRGSAAKDT